MLKRFLVFSYERYYPDGGWGDFRGAFATLEEARRCEIKFQGWGETEPDRAYIVDLETEEIVHEFETVKRY